MTSCPSCSASLPASAVSEQLQAARCPGCRALVDLGSSRVVPARPLNVPTPERWQVEATPGSLQVRWRWMSPAVFFLVPFTLFWNGLMLNAAAAAGGFAQPERLLIGLAVPHVWVGVGLAYYCLALFVNSTRVHLAEGTLQVQHGPLPWWGQRAIPAREVGQLFVLEKRGSKGSVSYELCGMLRDGKKLSLVSGLKQEAEARFLEVRLEQLLNLTDQHVAGELKR